MINKHYSWLQSIFSSDVKAYNSNGSGPVLMSPRIDRGSYFITPTHCQETVSTMLKKKWTMPCWSLSWPKTLATIGGDTY